MAETNAILNFQGKDDGFSKILNTASDGFDRLGESVATGKGNLANLRDESGLFEKAFKGLTGTVGKGQDAFDKLGDGAGAIASSFTASAKITDVTNQGFVKVAASALGLGKQVGFVNTVLGPLGDLWHEVDDAQSAVGKGFAVLNAVSKPLIGNLKAASEFTAGLAEKLDGVGRAGTLAASVLLGVSKTLGSLGTGVKVADIAGDVYRLVEATKEFTEEQLPELIEQAKGAAEMFDKLGVKAMLFGDRLKTIRTAATVLSAVGKGAVKELSQMVIKVLDFRDQVKLFVGMATSLKDAYLRLQGLNEGFETFQAMGVDTSMAELAVQIGVVGEGLFTNAEAAKNFAKTTITAFAQVEDKLAYLQTLSTAAGEGTDKLFSSMQALVSGPLKNSITTGEAAAASYFSMSAGADSLSKANLLTTTAIKGAVAGQVDQAQAINAVTNAMAPYKVNFRDADKVMGQFFATLEYGQLDMGNLTGAIGELSSSAASANIPLEQVLGMYAKLTQTGPPGEAATRLGNLLQDITNVSGPAQDELDKLGVRLDKFAIAQKGFLPVLQELYTKTGGNVQTLRKIFANDYSFQAFYSLMQDVEGAGKTITQVGDAGAETLDKMFNKRRESLMQKATELMNGFRGVMEEFGQRMLPMLEPFIDFLGGMLERFEQMPEPMKQFIAVSALTAIGIQKVTQVGGTFGGMIFNLGKMYLMARVSSLLWSGQLLNEGKILRDMVVNHKDYAGAIMRLFGIQQQSANAFTTIASAQEEAARAATLGKQADDARAKASQAQAAAAKLQEQAERLKAQAVTLSAEADQAAAVSSQAKAQADAVGGTNARLNAEADEAAAVSARARAIADEAGIKATQAQALADAKSIEAVKASQTAKDAAHNADLANKNASIRASQAAAAAEVEANKLSQAAVVARTKASQSTQTALELESVSAEKAAAATAAKSAADQAGGNNALLNARAISAQQAAQSAQTAASNAATKAIELNNAATVAEVRSAEMAAIAQSSYAEAQTAAAFATQKSTEAKTQNTAVSLADDDFVQTIDLSTGAVEANTAATSANTNAKTANAATSFADDAQTIDLGTGAVQANTAATSANTNAKAANNAVSLADDDAWQTVDLSTGAVQANTAATSANTNAKAINNAVSLADDDVQTIDLATGAVQANTVATSANTNAKAANAARSLADDDAWQTVDLSTGAVQANTAEMGANTAAKVTNTATTGAVTAAESVNTVATEANTKASFANTQARGLLGKINAVLTGQISAQNISMFANNMAMKTGAGATGLMAGAANVFSASMGAARAAAMAFWSTLGPITLALGLLYVGFNVFKELGQMLGIVGSEFTETAKAVNKTTEELGKMQEEMGKAKQEIAEPVPQDKGWLHGFLEELGLTRDETAEYTGFLNTKVYPALNLFAKTLSSAFGPGLRKPIDDFFKGLKDNTQAELERPMQEAIGKQDALVQNLIFNAKKLRVEGEKGKFAGEEAQKLLDKARADANKRGAVTIEGATFDEVIKKNREAIQEQTKLNDKAVEKLTEQLNDPKVKQARKDQLQVQIDALKQESSALEENLKKQEKYLQNIQSIAARVDENNASLSGDKTIANLKEQQKGLMEILKDSPDAIKSKYNDLFSSLETGMNNTSVAQRRMNNQLITAVKDFADNAKTAKDIASAEDLQKMQQDADTLINRVMQGVDTGSVSTELAQKLINEVSTQEITIDAPNFKFKGSVLTPEQQQAILDAQIKINQGLVDRQVAQIQQGIEDINLAESKGEVTQGQAQTRRLTRQIEIDKQRLDSAKKTEQLMLEAYGEKSPQYIKAVQERRAAERTIDKTNYDKRQAQDDYYTDRRVKGQERAIARIKSLSDRQRLTEGQAAIETLKREDLINSEQIARLKKRMAGMKDTTSDAYKDLQAQLEQLENDGQTKRFQIARQKEDYALDKRVKVHEDAIAQINLAEQTLLKTQGQAQQETLRREIEINAERVKLARSRLERIGSESGVGSDVYKNQLREVENLERDSTLKRFQLQRQQEDYALDRRVKVHEDAIAQINASEQTLLKTQGQAQQEVLQREIDINAERVKLQRQRLEDIGNRAGTGSDAYKDQLREVENLERESGVKRFQLQRQQEDYALERRVKVHEDAIAEISLSEKLLQRTQFEAGQETLKQEIAANNERIELAKQRLEVTRSQAGENSDIFQDQERELRALERSQIEKAFQLQTQEVVQGLEVQRQRITNQVEAQNQAYKAQLNELDRISASQQLQQELAESRNALIQTSSAGIGQQLENVGKLVSDERLNAQLQAVSAQARLDALEKSQVFERENQKRQERTRKMALDRQKIELQSNKLANQRAILEENISFRRLQATSKVTTEQTEQHRLMLSNLQQQDGQYVAQEENLNEQIASLQEINANAREELDIRQQQAKDGGVMDVLLAKQGQMTAQLSKEQEVLEKRNELEKARSDAYAGQLNILSQTTNSERKQRDVAAAIAAIKLNSLSQQQQGEAQVLELQIKQRAAVLEQEQSRLRMMDAENKARTAEAKERVLTAIAEGKSAEQIQARVDALKGYAEAGAAIKGAGLQLEERRRYEEQMAQYERSGLVARQVQDRQQAQLDLAQNLPMGLQRQMKGFIQGEVFNQLGTNWDNVQVMGRNAAYGTMAQGYDRRSAFPVVAPLEVPKPIDYEALRKDALAQLNEFQVPKPGSTPQQQQQVAQQKTQIEALQKTVDAIAQRQPNQLDQKNTFNINLPPGSTKEQAKSLEEPLIQLQSEIWQGVRKKLGLQ